MMGKDDSIKGWSLRKAGQRDGRVANAHPHLPWLCHCFIVINVLPLDAVNITTIL